MVRKVIVVLAVLALSPFVALPAAANPLLIVTGNHLGGGLVQYTLQVDNTVFGGNVAAQISVQGNIHQVPSAFFPDAGSNGGVSLQSHADTSDMFDPAYIAAGGKASDSWWEDLIYHTANPPFGGDLGGAVGSTLFQYSAGTTELVGPNVTLLGQIVIFDSFLLTFNYPIGPVPVVTTGRLIAPISIIDPLPSNPSQNSKLHAGGQSNSINGTFGLPVPEPSSAVLAGLGLFGLATYGLRRRQRL